MIAPSGGGTAVKLKEMKFQGRSWMKMLPARKQREVTLDSVHPLTRRFLMMDKQATAKLSTVFTSGAVRGCRKRDRTLQTAKLNASLASKIKSKLISKSH